MPTETNADEILLWGATGRSFRVKVEDGWTLPGRKAWVSPSTSYNKIYFDFFGANTVITAGDVLETSTIFEIQIAN